MPPKSNIYGDDSNAMAESIAASALTSGKGTEDVWGSRTDSRADSWDGLKEPQPGDVQILQGLKSGSGDDGNMDSDFSKNSPRHRTVSIAAEDGKSIPPPRFSGTK